LWNSRAIIAERLRAAGVFQPQELRDGSVHSRGDRSPGELARRIANYRRLIGKRRMQAHLVMHSLSPSKNAEAPCDAIDGRARLPRQGLPS
jgi:hypothetical protein